MNDTAQIILSVATLVTAIAAAVVSLFNNVTVRRVQRQTNGLMAKMEVAATAAGNLQGRADQKSETAATAAGNLQGRADEQAEFPKGR
jgi:hypothetical protein